MGELQFRTIRSTTEGASSMNFSDLKRQAAMVVVGIMSFVVAPAVQALNQVTTNLSEPMNLQATVSTFDCTNNPGPWINFEGAVTLAGLDVQLVFRNNINKDVHTRVEDVQTVVGVTTGVTIRIPKQPSHPFEGGTGTGAGGNPWISIQLVDDNGKPLSGEVLLGRCVQGAFNPSVDFSASVIAQAIIETLDCTNNPGPHINVSGSMSVSPGVKARIIFRNQRADGAPHEAVAMADVTLFSNGFAFSFPKQPVQGGVGGNPWISVRFADSAGQPIGPETLLGRCVQLLPGN
ncbi:MAG: hypothetical protein E6H62_07540 [Betaproteobacteria bacterium]|nr:MAG: hypothetical protein E6H62_07540 [Betaproteobacteria bacterium]